MGSWCRLGVAGLGLVLWGAAAGAATLAVMPVKMLDTSGEPRDQGSEHAARLDRMAAALAADLAGKEPFSATVRIPAAAVSAACPRQTVPCLLEVVRDHGADQAFFGVVHKSSSLIMQMFADVVDAGTGERILHRELNFRGDNDESWRRMEVFLARQLAEAK